MTVPDRSFLVCSLPRSGGRLLASTLRSTGAVAVPEPRFWSGWRGHPPEVRQQMRREADGRVTARAYHRIRAEGTAPDGTFGAEVRWPELERLVASLCDAPSLVGCGGVGGAEHGLMRAFLPGLRYVHLTREDKAAQAVAWWRARHARDSWDRPTGPVAAGDGIDHLAVEALERRLRADEWRWVAYFTRAGVEPLVISYEALIEDPTATVRRVLELLDVPSAATVAVPARPPAPATVPDRARLDYVHWRRCRASGRGHNVDAPVTVIVTGTHPADDVHVTAEAVRAGVGCGVEIVVVDGRSVPADPGEGVGDDAGARTGGPGAAAPAGRAPGAGPAAARNEGARRASGETLVFLDAGVHPRPGWLQPLREALAEPAVAVAGPAVVDPAGGAPAVFGLTWRDPLLRARRLEQHPGVPVPVPFVPSCCMAFRRQDFEAVGGFDVGLVTAGAEDAEICLHLWRRGRLCLVVPASEVGQERVAPAALPWVAAGLPAADAALHDALRLATVHFGPDTLVRTFEQAKGRPTFPAVYSRLVNSDVFERRRHVAAGSMHDDVWFLDRFDIEALR